MNFHIPYGSYRIIATLWNYLAKRFADWVILPDGVMRFYLIKQFIRPKTYVLIRLFGNKGESNDSSSGCDDSKSGYLLRQ